MSLGHILVNKYLVNFSFVLQISLMSLLNEYCVSRLKRSRNRGLYLYTHKKKYQHTQTHT